MVPLLTMPIDIMTKQAAPIMSFCFSATRIANIKAAGMVSIQVQRMILNIGHCPFCAGIATRQIDLLEQRGGANGNSRSFYMPYFIDFLSIVLIVKKKPLAGRADGLMTEYCRGTVIVQVERFISEFQGSWDFFGFQLNFINVAVVPAAFTNDSLAGNGNGVSRINSNFLMFFGPFDNKIIIEGSIIVARPLLGGEGAVIIDGPVAVPNEHND